MENMKLLTSKTYDKPLRGYSAFSGDPVQIIGEQTVDLDGRTLDQYIYNIEGYTAKNGKPFMALKANIVVLG